VEKERWRIDCDAAAADLLSTDFVLTVTYLGATGADARRGRRQNVYIGSVG
jgi:hypothetical protein